MQNDIGTFIFRRLCRLRQSTVETGRMNEYTSTKVHETTIHVFVAVNPSDSSYVIWRTHYVTMET